MDKEELKANALRDANRDLLKERYKEAKSTLIIDKDFDSKQDKFRTGMSTLLFVHRIKDMNETFQLPSNETPTEQGDARLIKFEGVLKDEVTELHDVLSMEDQLNRFVAVADCLGDLVVYCFSEARRWGIPLLDVLHIIMDSQDSKLVDGKPLMAPDGSKFIKGPNYEPPEPAIRELLRKLIDSRPPTPNDQYLRTT